MDIKNILKLFSCATLENYMKIVEQCDVQIHSKKDDAEAYYFRAMAKMGIACLTKLNNKLLLSVIPLAISAGVGNSAAAFRAGITLNNTRKYFENNYRIADSAVADYNKALFLDNNLRCKYNRIKVKATSDFTGADFIFYRPISSMELVDLLAGNKKWKVFAIPFIFWFILPFILLYFYGDDSGNLTNTGLFIELAYTIGLIFFVLFANNKDSSILQKYDKDIIVIKKSNNCS